MLAGFRSRWMIPFSCAASSASTIWRAIASASRNGQSAPRELVRQRFTVDELEDEKRATVRFLEAVDTRDVGMIERRENLSLALEASHTIGIVCESVWKKLDRDAAPEFCVARPVDFAHATGAQRADHFIRTETGARRECHGARRL